MKEISFNDWLSTNKNIRLNNDWTNEDVIKFWGRKSLYSQYIEDENL